jgi:hypothetical protein
VIRYHLTADASGAAQAGARGDVVVIVDVIDMSTTAEALWEEGVYSIWGAAPDGCRAPVKVDPERIGILAGEEAKATRRDVLIISEPRVATEEERKRRCTSVLDGLAQVGVLPEGVYPNLGAETIKQFVAKGKITILVTDTGGVAYDAAYQAGASAITTATVARTYGMRGDASARAGVGRALKLSRELGASITYVAASANSIEDVLAVEYLAKLGIDGV